MVFPLWFFETEFHYIAQTGFKLLGTNDLPTSIFPVAGTIGTCYRPAPLINFWFCFFVVLTLESRALYMVGKCFTTELHYQLFLFETILRLVWNLKYSFASSSQVVRFTGMHCHAWLPSALCCKFLLILGVVAQNFL